MFKGRLFSILMVFSLAMGIVGCSIFGDDDDETPTTNTASLSGTVSFPTSAGTSAAIKGAVDFAKLKCFINKSACSLSSAGAFSGTVTKASQYEIEVRADGNSNFLLKAVSSASGSGIAVNSTTTAQAIAYSAFIAQSGKGSTTYSSFVSLLPSTAATIVSLVTAVEDALKSAASLVSTTFNINTVTAVSTAASSAVSAANAAGTTTSTTTSSSSTTTTTTTTTTTSTSTSAPTISSVSTSSITSSGVTVSWTTSKVVSSNAVYFMISEKALKASTTFNVPSASQSWTYNSPANNPMPTSKKTLTVTEVVNRPNHVVTGTGGTSTAQSVAATGLTPLSTADGTALTKGYFYVVSSADSAGNTGFPTLVSSFTITADSTSTPTLTVTNTSNRILPTNSTTDNVGAMGLLTLTTANGSVQGFSGGGLSPATLRTLTQAKTDQGIKIFVARAGLSGILVGGAASSAAIIDAAGTAANQTNGDAGVMTIGYIASGTGFSISSFTVRSLRPNTGHVFVAVASGTNGTSVLKNNYYKRVSLSIGSFTTGSLAFNAAPSFTTGTDGDIATNTASLTLGLNSTYPATLTFKVYVAAATNSSYIATKTFSTPKGVNGLDGKGYGLISFASGTTLASTITPGSNASVTVTVTGYDGSTTIATRTLIPWATLSTY